MGILGSGFHDITVAIKDMILFFVAFTLIVFVAGQWFTATFGYNSNVFWYPTYLLIIVLVIKVIADAFTKKPKQSKEEKEKKE